MPFSFEGATVRTLNRGGDPWFVLADVCKVLDTGLPGDTARRLDDDEKGMETIHTPGGPQKVTVINESGLYSVVLTSRKEAAKRFKKWITSEVIPSIRKTGSYSLAAPVHSAGRAIVNLTARDGKVFASSREVAKMFDKRHDNILGDINDLEISSDLRTSFFIPGTAPDAYGRQQPAFDMTRDGFTLLAMGFTGAKAMKFKLAYIAEFNRIEEALRAPPAPVVDLNDPSFLRSTPLT